jgi:hypothetical protein
LANPERSEQYHVRPVVAVGRERRRTGGGRDQDHAEPGGDPPRFGDQRPRATFGQVDVRDQECGSVLPEEFEALGGAFGLPVDPEMVEAEEAPKQYPRLLVPGDDNGGRRRHG